MTKTKMMINKLALMGAAILSGILFLCANTNSCLMVHQPKAPKGLDKFSKVK